MIDKALDHANTYHHLELIPFVINQILGNYELKTDDSRKDALKVVYIPTGDTVATFRRDGLVIEADADFGGNRLFLSDEEPQDPSPGDVWIDTDAPGGGGWQSSVVRVFH